ncbi:MAG: C-type lectin domain-containing protein [Pirellulaceae bacterium]
MKTRLLILTASITMAASLQSSADIISGPVFNPGTGHFYYLLSQNTWTNSEIEAVTLGGHLVTLNDQAENDWVFDTFANFGGQSRALWTGYNDQQSEGTFVWSSGETPAFINWSGGQPDNGSPGPDPPGEDFVHLLWPGHPSNGAWNDFQDLPFVNDFPLHGVVEVPETGTAILLMAMALTLTGYRRKRMRHN